MNIPTQKENLLIIDFEATCANDNSIKMEEMEIIEFAGILVNKKSLEIKKEFTEFIKPVRHPKLTRFCSKLTTITQEMVDSGKTFSEVLANFNKVMNGQDAVFISWGYYDKNQLKQDCAYHKVQYPFDEEHINIKIFLAHYLKLQKPKSVGGMLKYLRLTFEGTPHRGIDDVKNILRIIRKVNDKENKLK